jgi:serine/threonine-protein kinase
MSPEQAATSMVDRRTDVFSLGVTLWEISTDKRLFKRKDDVDTLIAVAASNVPDPCALVSGYPRPFWRVLRRALRKEPEKRFSTALEMARELDACARAEDRKIGPKDVAEVMQALFPLEAEQDAAFLAEASSSIDAPVTSTHSSLNRLSVPEIAPEEWKKTLPPGLLNERRPPKR